MFSSMFKSFVYMTNKQNKDKNNGVGQKSVKTKNNFDDVLMLSKEVKRETICDSIESLVITDSKVSPEISSCLRDSSINCCSIGSFDDLKSVNR